MFRRLFFAHQKLLGEGLELHLSERTTRDRNHGIAETFTYDIFLPNHRAYAGYVSLRTGESPEIYYLGHIGYRVNPPYRGFGLAARAVRALTPLILDERFYSLSITTDTDNIPSRKTCENLGCVLENIVPVPRKYRELCMHSPAKCRYIYFPRQSDAERTVLHEPAG